MLPATYFRSKAPQRLPAALWSVIALLAGAIAMFSGTLKGAAFALLCALIVVVLMTAIVAPSQFLRDGDSGLPFVDLAVYTRHGRVLLTEQVLRESGLLTKLKALPGFDANAYDTAVQHELRDFMEPFGRRFRVLDVSPLKTL